MATKFSLAELMAVASSRQIQDGEIAFIGTGLPMLGAMLAKALHAPNAILIYEAGIVDARPKRTPVSIGDGCLVPGAAMCCGLTEALGTILQRGWVDVGFLGAAQINKYGDINTSVIGDYYHPKVRLPGSGGGNDIGSLAKRTVIMMAQDKRKFVEQVDYITTPGWLGPPGTREAAGLPRGGPAKVITNLGIYAFDENREIYLESHHPGISIEKIKQNVSWEIAISPDVRETEPPTDEELHLLREQFDPQGIFLGGRE
ncbi:MAG: CoA-transferase subunit beta [Chloroflexi bacterium]|nr:CoA-transferase subunit beta [Chloroflexota bacterium]